MNKICNIMNHPEIIKKYLFGQDKKLQFCGSCMAVIIPKVLLNVFNIGPDNREVSVRITKEGILICPKNK